MKRIFNRLAGSDLIGLIIVLFAIIIILFTIAITTKKNIEEKKTEETTELLRVKDVEIHNLKDSYTYIEKNIKTDPSL